MYWESSIWTVEKLWIKPGVFWSSLLGLNNPCVIAQSYIDISRGYFDSIPLILYFSIHRTAFSLDEKIADGKLALLPWTTHIYNSSIGMSFRGWPYLFSHSNNTCFSSSLSTSGSGNSHPWSFYIGQPYRITGNALPASRFSIRRTNQASERSNGSIPAAGCPLQGGAVDEALLVLLVLKLKGWLVAEARQKL